MIRRRTRSTSRTGRRSRSNNNDGRKRSTSKTNTNNQYEVEDKMNDLLTGYDSRLVSLRVFDGNDNEDDDEEEDKKVRPSKKISDMFPITRHRRTTKQSQSQEQGEDETAAITHHMNNSKVPRFKIRNSTSQSPVLNRHHRRQFSNDHHPSTDNNNNVFGRVKRRECVSQSPLTHRQRKQPQPQQTTPQQRSNSTTRSVSSTSTYVRYSNNVQPPQSTKFVTSKLDATHCIFLGHPGQVKTSSSQHVQSGLKLKYTYLQQYTHPSDTKGCLVLEGPPPLLQKFKSTNEPFLWTVPITFSSKQPNKKIMSKNKPKRLSHYDDTHHDREPTTMEALQHVNTYVHELIKVRTFL